MNAPSGGRRRECSPSDARQRLHDADAFLEAALRASDPDVKATNAIHSAITSADAICCVALGRRSADGNHVAAAQLLSIVDRRLSTALRRAIDRKTQAGYESRDISAQDAESCVRQATMLLEGARARVRAV